MKRTISFAILTLTAGLMMVFAASPAPAPKAPDACAEKYKSSMDSCTNQQANCKARGSTPETCEARHKECVAAAEKAKQACEGKK